MPPLLAVTMRQAHKGFDDEPTGEDENMKAKPQLNGSVELLASAMRTVFKEAMTDAVEPIHNDMVGIREDMATKTDLADSIGLSNKNMQAQFAEQEKKISKLISNR